MVASVKECLRKVLGNARLTYDELVTSLVEIKVMLNSRPLTYEYTEVDEGVLTPSHLIYGRRIRSMPDEITEPDDLVSQDGCTSRFISLSTGLAHFWSRWRRERVLSLQGRKST